MKHALAVAFLLAGSLSAFAADEKSFPQKGDTVYLSVELRSIRTGGYGQQREHSLPACSPITITKISEEKIVGKDDSGTRQDLYGDWSKAIHHDRESCREYSKAHPDDRAVAEHHGLILGMRFIPANDNPH